MPSKLIRSLGAAAVAAAAIAAFASPAAAQPYNYPYGYNPGAQILQSVIDQMLGGGYSVSDRTAVHRCASAALAEAHRHHDPYGDDYGFGSGYGYGYDYRYQPQMRVTAITQVDRRSSGLRIRGLIDSGMLYAMPGVDPRYPGVDPRYRQGDLMFRCNVDYRGRVWDVRVTRNPGFHPH